MNLKNRIIVVFTIVLIFVIAIIISIMVINNKSNNQVGLQVKGKVKPPLNIAVLKNDTIAGQAIGIVSSWKYEDRLATSSLVSAKKILEKEDALMNVEAGDIVKLELKNFNDSLKEKIYEITYNAMDDNENYILPINEIIDFSSKIIEVPILRENLNKTLYYHVTIKIKDKGTVVYFFKIIP